MSLAIAGTDANRAGTLFRDTMPRITNSPTPIVTSGYSYEVRQPAHNAGGDPIFVHWVFRDLRAAEILARKLSVKVKTVRRWDDAQDHE